MGDSGNKRILVITNMYPNQKNKSFGIFVKNQVDALKSKGLVIDVVSINDSRMGKILVLKKYFIWFFKFLYRLLVNGKKYDVIHSHYVFPSGFLGLFFKQLYGTKLVITAHGGDIDKMARKSLFFFKQTKKVLQHADEIIAVGEKLKNDIVNDFDISDQKVTVLNMGVNRQIFKPQDKQLAKREIGLNIEKSHLLFVGNKIKAKGIRELVTAFKLVKKVHPNIELHLIGDNKEPYFLREIESEILEEQINDVYFYPSMGQKDIARWMAAADIFILPSHMEGFGLVALEAMSCHTPVIGSDVGGLSYLLGNGAGVLVPPNDFDALKNGITEVLSNPELRDTLVRLGEEKAREYSEVIQIEKLLVIYGMIGARQ